MSASTPAEDLLRELAPQVLGAVVRRYGHFGLAEDAVQEAMLAAAAQWPAEGVPGNPRGWLVTVAARRLTDLLRAEQARKQREGTAARLVPQVEGEPAPPGDDTLVLLFLCCHPALSPASQIALTLRAVGGLSTAQIARAFLVPEATMTRRISRAKRQIAESGIPFRMPPGSALRERLGAVLHVLYLVFTEGYATTSGPELLRPDLSAEAIRLTRIAHRLMPDDSEVGGLLALMLLTDARRPARIGPGGEPVPLAEQDRRLWNSTQITEGTNLLLSALAGQSPGRYQLEAAIAALHDEASSPQETDWAQIVALYRRLLAMDSDNPALTLNYVVAVAMARGPADGLDLLRRMEADHRVLDDHRLETVRAHLLELAGDLAAARTAYLAAAARTTSLPRRRYLTDRATRLADVGLGECREPVK